MSKEKEAKPAHVRAYAIRKAKEAKRKKEYWKARWREDPISMRSHLDKLNEGRIKHGKERMERLMPLLSFLASSGPVMSADLKPKVSAWITIQRSEPKPAEVISVIAFLRRKQAIVFDANGCYWKVMVA